MAGVSLTFILEGGVGVECIHATTDRCNVYTGWSRKGTKNLRSSFCRLTGSKILSGLNRSQVITKQLNVDVKVTTTPCDERVLIVIAGVHSNYSCEIDSFYTLIFSRTIKIILS